MPDGLVAIVDDDADVRTATAFLLRAAGFRTEAFSGGDAFLLADPRKFSCVILDLRMPGTDGMMVIEKLSKQGRMPPVVVVTAHGETQSAVRALKLGAYDFIEKPYRDDLLLAAVAAASAMGQRTRNGVASREESSRRFEVLSERERAVLQAVAQGKPSKIISYELGLSIRTVETYRASGMRKLGVRGTADIVRIMSAAGLLQT